MTRKNKFRTTALIALLGLIFLSSNITAQSYGGKHHNNNYYDRGWWNSNVPSQYQLTPDQIKGMNQYRTDYDTKIIPLQKELRALRIEMRGYINRNNMDPGKIKDYRKQIREIENQIEDYRLEARDKINGILTDNQRVYFNDNSIGWWDVMYDKCGWGYGDMDYDNDYYYNGYYGRHGCW
ncbi:MAG: Spy/CpxP family protein refolding chaperone [Ignavibacteriaceae bacterium]